jgi:hypothetical protein
MMPLKNGLGLLKIMRDQTDRRRVEHALREGFEPSHNIFCSSDRKVWVSGHGEAPIGRLHGLSEGNSLGLGWMDAVHPANHELTHDYCGNNETVCWILQV